jgi:hypothetical protein
MRKFISTLMLCATMAIASPVFAVENPTPTTLDVSGLSESAVKELQALAAKKVAENPAAKKVAEKVAENPAAQIITVSAWGEQASRAAEGFAKALALAARELGVTVNSFIETPAGKITAAIIIWKVIGTGILKIIVGIGVITFGQLFARWIFIRLFTSGTKTVEYSYFGGIFKGTKEVRIKKGFNDLHKDGEWMMLWVGIIASVATMIAGAVIIT